MGVGEVRLVDEPVARAGDGGGIGGCETCVGTDRRLGDEGARLACTLAVDTNDAAGRVFGPWGASMLSAGVLLSTLGYLSGMMLAVPRALFAFARDGFLPRALASVHARYRTPHVAIVTQAVLVVALALSSGFERLVILANLSVLFVYLACCVASWELRRRDVRAGGTPFRVPAAGVAPVLACVVIVLLLSSITAREWGSFGAVAVVAIVIYVVTRGRRRASAAAIERPSG